MVDMTRDHQQWQWGPFSNTKTRLWKSNQSLRFFIGKRTVIFFVICLTGFWLTGCSPVSDSEKERNQRIKSSAQNEDGKFVNPNAVKTEIFSSDTWEVSKEYIFGTRVDPRPNGNLPVRQLDKSQWHNPSGFSFAWLGHSSLMIKPDNVNILVDPVLEDRASPFSWVGPKRFHPAPVRPDELPNIDVVLITHDHYDHLEKPTMIYLSDKVQQFIVPLGIGALLEDWGIKPAKIIELDWWESTVYKTLEFHATPAVHYANRGLLDGNKRLWCSWSILGTDKRFFISGDSGYFDGFKEIGQRLGPFDVTFLKIGAYNDKGTWRAMHMTPEEAHQQHMDLGGKLLVPLHWATFDLGLHPWYEPIERLLKAAEGGQTKIATPEVGQKIDLDQPINYHNWWQQYK